MRIELHITSAAAETHRDPRWTMTRRLRLGLLLSLALLFVHAVWPTRYSYRDVQMGIRTVTLRIDRLTNEATEWRPEGWQSKRR